MRLSLSLPIFVIIMIIITIAYLLSAKPLFAPWYIHRTPEEGRVKILEGSTRFQIFRGKVNDPKVDFGRDYYNVSFPSTQNNV